MQASILSSFLSFELTPEEEMAAYEFNDCQIAGIQNQLAGYAEDLLKVVHETDDLSLVGAKKLAYTKGAIDALRHLLAMGDTIKEQRAEQQAAKDTDQQ